jgi:hypothetical protein|nr:hypothetical protein [Prevotella sp.]
MMKKLIFLAIGLFAGVNVITAGSENVNTFSIRTPKFVRPLIERWVSEYNKVNTHANVLIENGIGENSSALQLVLDDNSVSDGNAVVYFGQYAILPVTTRGSEAEHIIGGKALNDKKLKNLYFRQNELDALENGKKKVVDVNVYAGNSKSSVSKIYASYLGEDDANYRGKRISGDDAFLNIAISKDVKGVTINALPNIFDLQSRKLKSNLVILPLSMKKEYADDLSSNADLDKTISLLENEKIEGVPIEKIGFSFDMNNSTIRDFVNWIISNGTTLNHAYGLLNLNDKTLVIQKQKLGNNFLTAQK